MIPRPLLFKHVAFGLVAGAVISITPMEFGILVVPGFLILWIYAMARRPLGRGVATYLVAGLVALATISVAAILPVKHLEQKVGPIHYENMSLDGVVQALRRDYRVFLSSPHFRGDTQFLTFRTEREMTRREVLEKLAADSGPELHIGYCGSGASFLFGAFPSFTSLREKSAVSAGVVDSRPQ